jgi:hypothetical protein
VSLLLPLLLLLAVARRLLFSLRVGGGWLRAYLHVAGPDCVLHFLLALVLNPGLTPIEVISRVAITRIVLRAVVLLTSLPQVVFGRFSSPLLQPLFFSPDLLLVLLELRVYP